MLTRRGLIQASAFGAVAMPALLPMAAHADRGSGRPGFFKARDIAEAAYIYGLPLVMNYGIMSEFAINKDSGQFKAPFNQIGNEGHVATYKDTAVVTPNSDTPYSILWLDLRAEPMVISVPAIDPKRYYSVQMIDGNTFIYGYVGTRATGNVAGSYMITGPGWSGEAPKGVAKVFQSSTDFSLLIFRTQLFTADDIDNVTAIQAQYKAQPLSAFLGVAPPPQPAMPDFPAFSAELAKTNFLEFLDFSLDFAPAQANEVWIREQLGRIGVGPNKTFSFRDLSVEDKAEILLGLDAGKKKVDAHVASLGTAIHGWNVSAAFGDAGFYHGDWLLRAAAAQAGIYGNIAEEAMYPATRRDADGNPLDGSKANYTITFAKDQLPPVNAFWSITLYDGKTQLLIENPINRYLINSPMLPGLKRNDDGSLTIYIQNKSPGADKEANWLPAPNGPIYLVMRLYWPRVDAPSILPAGSGTWQPPAIVKA